MDRLDAQKRISNNTLAVLAVIVILVAVISTLIIVSSVYPSKETITSSGGTQSASVNLNIQSSPPLTTVSSDTGKVVFDIRAPGSS